MRISVFRVVLNLTQDMWRLWRYSITEDLYFGSGHLLYYIRFIKYIVQKNPGLTMFALGLSLAVIQIESEKIMFLVQFSIKPHLIPS